MSSAESNASNPLRFGMATSATITSGRSLSAASIMARPSSTIPTSSNSSGRSALRPSAIMRWSSASNTRGRTHGAPPRFNGARATILVPPPGALSMRSSPPTRERRCLIPASPRLGRGLFSGWIETDAIVPYGKLKFAADRAKLDLDRSWRLNGARRCEAPPARPCTDKGTGPGPARRRRQQL